MEFGWLKWQQIGDPDKQYPATVSRDCAATVDNGMESGNQLLWNEARNNILPLQ